MAKLFRVLYQIMTCLYIWFAYKFSNNLSKVLVTELSYTPFYDNKIKGRYDETDSAFQHYIEQ